jgi:PAS domain S-box-containing protein
MADRQVMEKHRAARIKIVFIYIAFGLAWIYGSDTLLGWLLHDPEMLVKIAVVKGFFFIFCTAALLYLLIGRFVRRLVAAEAERIASLQNYRAIFNATNEAILVHALENGKILDVNDSTLEMYGYTRDEALALNIEQMSQGTPPYSQKEAVEYIEKATSQGPQIFEWHCRRKNGELFWAEVSLKVVVNGGNKKIIAVVRDISERKQMENKLKESEERFKALHNASFGGITIHDKGLILECNQGLAEISGYSVEELIGMDGLLLIAPSARELVLHNIASGYEKAYEAVGIRKNGEEYPLRLEARKVPYKGKIVRTVEFRDITENKRYEAEQERMQKQLEQAQKMESVGRLAGGIAHDFNNMLGVILGYSEMLLDLTEAGHPMHSGLKGIQQAAVRSADLTRQLLAFARKQTVAPKVLDLNETVEGMLKMLRRLIGEDIDLAWMPGEELGPVKIDPSQIDQILANLCVNARDAIGDTGKVTIKTDNVVFDALYCAEHHGTLPGDFVLLAVSDDGCGMEHEILSHLFEPFFTTKEMGKGTGLGLSMVYGIVKQNNGFINVYSEPGLGTTFKIYLPRYNSQSEGKAKIEAVVPVGTGLETILLVEDEPMILEMTVVMLQRLGYTILPAATPGEALQLARRHANAIDLLMTDVVMPEMNGRDLAKSLQSLYPELKCLFMSGYTANVIAHHGVLDEGVNFLQKPFSQKDLAAKIRQTLAVRPVEEKDEATAG